MFWRKHNISKKLLILSSVAALASTVSFSDANGWVCAR